VNNLRYFISDLHFGHDYNGRGIITFERTNFKSIEEHDGYLRTMISNLCRKLKPSDEVWNLGDFGCLDQLDTVDWIKETGAKAYFIYGNHDQKNDLPQFEKYFDQVFLYPIFLSQKLVVSHFPVAVYPDSINICGHLHGAKLRDINHVCASVHVANYHPITDKSLDTIFSKLPKFTRRFLYEPWANDYQFIQPKEDVIMDPNGVIDLSASRLLQKLNTDRRIQEMNSYQPYHGEGNFND
jgi:calcineurin-like phosphoesterase family protein